MILLQPAQPDPSTVDNLLRSIISLLGPVRVSSHLESNQVARLGSAQCDPSIPAQYGRRGVEIWATRDKRASTL